MTVASDDPHEKINCPKCKRQITWGIANQVSFDSRTWSCYRSYGLKEVLCDDCVKVLETMISKFFHGS